jgi:hypothetical protein
MVEGNVHRLNWINCHTLSRTASTGVNHGKQFERISAFSAHWSVANPSVATVRKAARGLSIDLS